MGQHALSWESKHCWEKWADHLEGVDDAGMARFHRVGKAFLDVDIAAMDRVFVMFDRAGIPYELWDADEWPAGSPVWTPVGSGRRAASTIRSSGRTAHAVSARSGPPMRASSTTPAWRYRAGTAFALGFSPNRLDIGSAIRDVGYDARARASDF